MASKILGLYAEKTTRSRAPHERAKALLSNGVTHIGRYLEPHPVHVQHAAGLHKWDVDGNEDVDYFSGHGALNPGHNYPKAYTMERHTNWNLSGWNLSTN